MTDSKIRTEQTRSDPPAERKKLVDLSPTQLVAGALAAMTSAVIGARLGVAGTVIGAAVASLVAGVAGSLYTASLRHTKDKLSSALVGKVGDTPVELTTVSGDDATTNHGAASSPLAASTGDARADDTWTWDAITEPAALAPASIDPVAADVVVDDQGRTVKQWPWKHILVSTVAVFLLAIAGITGYELVSGQSVSGGQGTTIGQVTEGRSGGSDPAPSKSPSSTPSSSTSTSPSSEPSATSEPSSSTTSEPTEEPSTNSEPTTSSEPSASSEPSSAPSASTSGGDADDNAADSGGAGNTGDTGTVAGG